MLPVLHRSYGTTDALSLQGQGRARMMKFNATLPSGARCRRWTLWTVWVRSTVSSATAWLAALASQSH
jgi:hypothetical protein